MALYHLSRVLVKRPDEEAGCDLAGHLVNVLLQVSAPSSLIRQKLKEPLDFYKDPNPNPHKEANIIPSCTTPVNTFFFF